MSQIFAGAGARMYTGTHRADHRSRLIFFNRALIARTAKAVAKPDFLSSVAEIAKAWKQSVLKRSLGPQATADQK